MALRPGLFEINWNGVNSFQKCCPGWKHWVWWADSIYFVTIMSAPFLTFIFCVPPLENCTLFQRFLYVLITTQPVPRTQGTNGIVAHRMSKDRDILIMLQGTSIVDDCLLHTVNPWAKLNLNCVDQTVHEFFSINIVEKFLKFVTIGRNSHRWTT